ncbi:MAG: hypothetical protein DPW09_01440 [Anaerolineae bacterium]|nr:hypothetical protein [Anaerolineae bacterium]
MKKSSQRTWLLVLFVVLVLNLVACSIDQPALPANPPSTNVSPETQASPPPLGNPVGPMSPAEATRQASLGTPVAVVYNPTDGSLFKADQQGLARWQAGLGWQSVVVPGATSLTGVVINPKNSDNLYVAGPGLGVSRSDDGGASWQTVNYGLPNQEITALAINSSNQETLYAWISNIGIHITEDGGVNWQKVPEVAIADPKVYGLTHSPLPGSLKTDWLYAATPSGAYLSMD